MGACRLAPLGERAHVAMKNSPQGPHLSFTSPVDRVKGVAWLTGFPSDIVCHPLSTNDLREAASAT